MLVESIARLIRMWECVALNENIYGHGQIDGNRALAIEQSDKEEGHYNPCICSTPVYLGQPIPSSPSCFSVMQRNTFRQVREYQALQLHWHLAIMGRRASNVPSTLLTIPHVPYTSGS